LTKIIFDSERKKIDRKYEFSKKKTFEKVFIFEHPSDTNTIIGIGGLELKRARSKLQNANYM